MTPAEERARYDTLAAHMRTLLDSPEWAALANQIEDIESQCLEQLIGEPTERRAGFIQGLRTVVHYPAEVIRAAHTLREEHLLNTL